MALGEAIVTLLKDKQTMLAMGQRGRERVERYFSEQIHEREILSVFENLTVKCDGEGT